MKDDEKNRAIEPVQPSRPGRLVRPSVSLGMVTERLALEVRQSGVWLQSPQMRRRVALLLSRMTSHAAILFVSLVAITLAGLRLGSAAVGGTGTAERQTGSVGRSPTVLVGSDPSGVRFGAGFQQAGASGVDGSIILRDAAIDFNSAAGAQAGSTAAGAQATRRSDITTYNVQPGDVIESIASRFGLQPTTIVWANQEIENNPDLLKVGQELTILPTDGVYYTVQSGDTTAGIAKRFSAEAADVIGEPLNNLNSDGSNLLAGVQIFIPKGVKADSSRSGIAPVPSRRIAAPAASASGDGMSTGTFNWPTNGYISQGYWSYHHGIDIANSIGTQISAADGGYVKYAGWSNVGYGYMVEVDHGNGFVTLYAHMSYFYVDVGQYVSKGQALGLMGSTGNSTGPHLHFEVRYGGGTQNPFSYLP